MRNFALETYFSKWEFSARHHMTASDTQSLSIRELLELAGEPIDSLVDLHLGYTETWGAPSLREAIAKTYDNISADNLVCFAGAEEGVYAAMRVLLQSGDHAIVVVPNYQAAETLPLDICEVSGVQLDPANNWHLDLDDIRNAIRPNTKLISVCFPNNPTGAIIDDDDYVELIEICRTHGLYLFSDEVYRLLELDETKRIDQAADVYEKALSLNVMSKAYGMPGLRIGWIATQDREVLNKLEQYKHYLSICNSAPSERLAEIALSVREKLLEKNRRLMADNIKKLDAFFADYPDLFEWHHPDGGCIAFPRFTGYDSVDKFCSDLVEQSGVLLLPASVYRSELMQAPTDRFRIGFGRDNMDEGLSAFRGYLEENRSRLTT
jgi:aspartate/methionine/tyrosine aminotransferase